MEEVRRKPGRPPKHKGLTPEVSDESELRSVRGEERQPERPVLPDAQAREAGRNGEVRLFGTSQGKDTGGGQGNLAPAVLNPPSPVSDGELSFTDLLKQVLKEIAPSEYQDGTRIKTKAEIIAAKVVEVAMGNTTGSMRARELIVERIEGKAQRANPVSTPDTTLEDQIDKTALAMLNELAAPAKETP